MVTFQADRHSKITSRDRKMQGGAWRRGLGQAACSTHFRTKITHLEDALPLAICHKGDASCVRYMRDVARAGDAASSVRGKVMEDMIRPTAARTPIRRALLALLALGGTLLTLSSGPAEAATTFTVNKTGDARDRKISGARAAPSKHNPRARAEKPPALAGWIVTIRA